MPDDGLKLARANAEFLDPALRLKKQIDAQGRDFSSEYF
jgi:hypothetical protein